MANGESDQSGGRVGDQWHTGIADQGDACAPLHGEDQFGSARHFIVFVVADQWLLNFAMIEEFQRVACVFARDLVDFFQDANVPAA